MLLHSFRPCILVLISLAMLAYATVINGLAEPKVNWIREIDGAVPFSDYFSIIRKNVVDQFGSSVVCAQFKGNVRPSTSSYHVIPNELDMPNGLLIKYSAEGKVEWVKQIVSEGMSQCDSVVVDNHGRYFVTFHSTNKAEFEGLSLDAGSYVTLVESSGRAIFTKAIPAIASYISIDSENNLYMHGSITENTIQFNETFSMHGIGNYVAKYDQNITFQWATSFHGEFMNARGIATNENGETCVIADSSSNNITFPNGKSYSHKPGQQIAFIVKYDKNGNLLWVNSMQTVDKDLAGTIARSVAIDKKGQCYMAGDFRMAIKIGDEIRLRAFLSGTSLYLVKFDPSGKPMSLITSGSLANAGYESVHDIQVDAQENVYIAGQASQEFMFAGKYLKIRGEHFVVFKMNRNWELLWMKQGIGGAVSAAHSLAVDRNEQVYVGATYQHSMLTIDKFKLELVAGYDPKDAIIFQLSENRNKL